MDQITLDKPDGSSLVIAFSGSRDSVIRDYLKAVKQDDYAGTWNSSNFNDLHADPPPVPRVTHGGKRYLLSQARLDELVIYLADVKEVEWDKSWSLKENTLMSGFSDAIPKDGT